MKLLFDVFLKAVENARIGPMNVDILRCDNHLSRLLGKKVSSNTIGITGYIVGMEFESLGEARDTMVLINWDRGGHSCLPTLSGESITVYGV